MFSSMHTHTIFCDGRDTIEAMCQSAYEKKLCAIGFSAHAPLEKQLGEKTAWHLPQERLLEYISQVNEAKSRWQGKIDVFLGLEVDYIKGIRSCKDSDIQAINADYLISSVHYLTPPNGSKLFTIDGPEEEFTNGLHGGFAGDGEALMHCYYDTMAEMITLGGFDILGHADLLKKNCENKNYWTKEKELKRQAEIAHTVGGLNSKENTKIMVELNTGGLNRKKVSETYPSLDFLRFFNQNNVPAIITADAHNAAHISENYDIALKTLIDAGYSYHLIPSIADNGKILMQKENIHC